MDHTDRRNICLISPSIDVCYARVYLLFAGNGERTTPFFFDFDL